ncbi:MAG: ribulose bisphosphate carboxylase small subunit [Phormidesmis sp.]
MVNPKVHLSADIHEFSLVEGDVSIGAGTTLAPGTAVTAMPGASVAVSEQCLLLPGVIVEGQAGAQVMSNNRRYSVWLGDRTTLAHKSIIHSPAFLGKDCFVGFRSTIFNARLGDGCIVMMHALVQDVEIPPGRCVASGSIITSQHQADQLPKVTPEDLALAAEIAGISSHNSPSQRSSANRSFSRSKGRVVPINSSSRDSGSRASSIHSPPERQPRSSQTHSTRHSSYATYATKGANMQAQRLSSEIVQQVRQHLSQGYRIGMEHADKRRYRSGVWETCTPVQANQEPAVFEALERCLAEHTGEYVRMFGIDPKVKRRVGMTTVQRPDSQPVSSSQRADSSGDFSQSSYGGGRSSSGGRGNDNQSANRSAGGLSPEVVQEVRGLLRSGHIIGTEHADTRHYRSNVWKSCSPIASHNEQEVFSRLEHCLDEHNNEFVRMFGIDPKAKRRTATTTIQRADGKPVDISPSRSVTANGGTQRQGSQHYGQHSAQGGGPSNSRSSNSGDNSRSSNSGDNSYFHNSEAAQIVSQIINQGSKVGVEIADARRYRSGIWQTAPALRSVNQLDNFLSQHPDKYVRVFGVNDSLKTRGAAVTIQKPGQSRGQSGNQSGGGQSSNQKRSPYAAQAGRDPINTNPPHYDDPAYLKKGAGYGNSGGNSGYGSSGGNGGYGSSGSDPVDSKVMDQVTQLVNQGCKIAIEFADKRRFRSGIWQTGTSIDARRPAEAISALGKQLAQHEGDYVRLVGVDPKAKRRVLETTIQRPL